MVSSIDNISSPSQSASHYEKDDPVHRETSPWAATGAEALGQRQFRLLANGLNRSRGSLRQSEVRFI